MKKYISVTDIKAAKLAQQNADEAPLEMGIELAQDKRINTYLSKDLATVLNNYVNRDTATVAAIPAYDALLAEIKKCHLYWAMHEAAPFIYTKISNRGMVGNGGEGIDKDQYAQLVNSYNSSANHYAGELIKFLELNAADYLGYEAPKSDSTTKLIAGVSF